MNMTTTETRKYAFTRLDPGDYLLPSNDGSTCLRFERYEEDGSAGWNDDKGNWVPIIGKFWRVLFRAMPRDGLLFDVQIEDFLCHDGWRTFYEGALTRKDALAYSSELVEQGMALVDG